MLADPQVITLQGVSSSLPNAKPDPANGSRYWLNDGTNDYEVLVTYNRTPKRNRAVVRLNHVKLVEDTYNTVMMQTVSASFTFVIDSPVQGYTSAQVTTLAGDLVNYLDTAGLLAKIVGGET